MSTALITGANRGIPMDIPVHNQILWHACCLANKAVGKNEDADDASLLYFPSFVRGSWCNDMNQVSAILGGDDQFPEIFFRELWSEPDSQIQLLITRNPPRVATSLPRSSLF